MTIYTFSAGKTQAFLPTSDVVEFSNGISARDVTVTSTTSGVMFTTTEGSMVLTGVVLGQLTTSNIVFFNGSILEIGDNTTNTSTDNSANSPTGTPGNDQLFGMDGSDVIAGDAGNDIIFGGRGIIDWNDAGDTISGGTGSDVIYANGGNDVVTSSTGSDTVYGGAGNDSITYENSNDKVLLFGNTGSDTLIGGTSADTIYGGNAATDRIDASDSINGGGGADVIYANAGNDTVTGTAAGGNDTVYGGTGNDVMNYTADIASSTRVLIYGNEGNDTISGTSGNDTIYGGSATTDALDGRDSIVAGAGADLVYANSGDDTITGAGTGTSTSTVYGGNGNDVINWSAVTGGYGAFIYGNEGSDRITASTGAVSDLIQGGNGSDVIIFSAATDLSSDDSIGGGDASTDNSNTDTIKFSVNGVTLSADNFSNVSAIEAIIFLSDATGTSNSITLSDAFVSSSATSTVTISLATTGAGTGTLTVDASAVTSNSNSVNAMGGNGSDTLTGGGGADSLNGGGGNDRFNTTISRFLSDTALIGGTGTDNLVFSDAGNINFTTHSNITGIDTVTLAAHSSGNYTITLSSILVSSAETGILTIDDSAATSGDSIDGSLGTAAESIIGGSGTNTITGGSGADSINLGSNSYGSISLYTDNHAAGATTGDLARGTSNMDTITNFDLEGILRFSGGNFVASLIANRVTAGTAAPIASMTDATHFSNGTIGAVEYWDDGTHTYIRVNTANSTSYDSSTAISFKLAGITTGTAGGTHEFSFVDNDISTNLITNGSFEFNNGTTGITGWTLVAHGDTYVDAQVFHSGQWEFAIGASLADATLTQSNIAAVDGEHYTLSFWLALGTYDDINSFSVIWNGETVASLDNLTDQDYIHYTYDVVGTVDNSTLEFVGRNNTYFTFLDDVSLIKA